MSENPAPYAPHRAPIGGGLFVERAGHTISIYTENRLSVEVLLILNDQQARALVGFLQTAKSPLARAFGSD